MCASRSPLTTAHKLTFGGHKKGLPSPPLPLPSGSRSNRKLGSGAAVGEEEDPPPLGNSHQAPSTGSSVWQVSSGMLWPSSPANAGMARMLIHGASKVGGNRRGTLIVGDQRNSSAAVRVTMPRPLMRPSSTALT
jgi:hypothetical protein